MDISTQGLLSSSSSSSAAAAAAATTTTRLQCPYYKPNTGELHIQVQFS